MRECFPHTNRRIPDVEKGKAAATACCVVDELGIEPKTLSNISVNPSPSGDGDGC